ncbi:olfactory receptor 11A1-like [Antennarius striatus]|uniref:olfactory receptor 11A1-like n=1 Tax=Antennarius striatus TaxID=241820 RepID=UPI0035AD8E43
MFMDIELNMTFITLGGYVEVEKYRYLYFLIMLTFYILIICCNSVIVFLILIHQNLHEPMYIFIAALLINSVLFSTTVYPKILIDSLSESQIISYPACLFQVFVFYSVAASDFSLLAVMSYDRYVSICKPLQYPTIMRKTTVKVLLCLAWLLPVIHFAAGAMQIGHEKLCSFSIMGFYCNSSLLSMYCEKSRPLYGLFLLVITVIIPSLFILFTYTRIFMISYQSSRDVRRKAAQTCLPHLIVLISFTCICAFDGVIPRLKFVSKTVRLIMTLQVIVYTPLFNPIIYGLKMKEIYKHLKRLFCKGKLKPHLIKNNRKFHTFM